jgi:hypothetical protein
MNFRVKPQSNCGQSRQMQAEVYVTGMHRLHDYARFRRISRNLMSLKVSDLDGMEGLGSICELPLKEMSEIR